MANLIERAKQLPADLRMLFFSDDPMLAGEEASILYGLPTEKASAVTLPLGAIFVGDMKLGDYPSDIATKAGVDEGTACGIAFEVNKRIFLKFPEHFKDAKALQRDWEKKKKPPVMNDEEAKKKVFELEPWLLEKDEEEVAAAEAAKIAGPTSDKLSLLAALGKYARLGEQIVTASKLSLKGNPEPVRGNLVNWLKVYRDELGVGYHDPVLRAKFLFNSPNAKSITSEERERLNLILRSVEENAPLDIDLSKMEIVFPSFQVTEPKAAPAVAAPIVPAPAPKRQGMFPNPAPAPAVPSVPSGGLRMGKGMNFTGIGSKPVAPTAKETPSPPVAPAPAPPKPAEGGFSFSSKHAFPAERAEEGGLSINRPSGSALPSGQAFFRSGQGSQAAASPTPKPVAPKMSPFQIRPVSLHGKSGDEDMGRIVDLRNE